MAGRKQRGIVGRLSLSPGAAVLLAALLYLGQEKTLLIYGLAALCHEGGHWLAAWCCGLTLRQLRITPSGGMMTLSGACALWQEGIVLLAGPCCNLLQGVVCIWLGQIEWGGAALLLGSLNLLPIGPLDGGQLIRLLLTGILGEQRGAAGAMGVSLTVLAGLLGVGGWLFLRANATPALLLFALWLLFFTISSFFPCHFRR